MAIETINNERMKRKIAKRTQLVNVSCCCRGFFVASRCYFYGSMAHIISSPMKSSGNVN